MGRLMKNKALPIMAASLALGLSFDWLFYDKVPGISAFLYTALILGITFYFSWQFKKPLNPSVYWLAPIAIFFSLMVFIRANPFLAFVNIVLVIYLLTMVARLAHKPKLLLQHYDIAEYFDLMIVTPLGILREFFQFLAKLLSSRNNAAPKSSATPIIRGIILSLPILAVFLLLLSSADMVFKQYVGSLFNPDISPETVFRLGLIGFVASLFAGAYALIFMPSGSTDISPAPVQKRFKLGTTESSIILGSVGLLFFVFVLIQAAYLFGGKEQITSSFGYTYAEYAHKGFFELIAVAAISFALLLSIKRSVTFHTLPQTMTFKWLSGVLIAEVMVIMLSAHMRLDLYEEAYGFTALRLWSHLFILWLVAAFALLIVHVIKETSQKNLAFQLFISVLCFFAVINMANPDAFTARHNLQRFNDTGKLDAYYLGKLSEDATPTIAGFLDDKNKKTREHARDILNQQKRSISDGNTPWQSANLAKHRANQIFEDNSK